MKSKGKVVAEGEATGHRHVLQNTEVFEVSPGYLKFEVVTDDEFISHQEHKPIPIAKGKRAAGIVKEYSHFDEEARPVAD